LLIWDYNNVWKRYEIDGER